MKRKIIIGAGFGDEGKGLFTDYLCRTCKNPLVIRFSGGQQAGHTVMTGGIRHIFSNFGSGTLQGAASYFSKFCTIDPVGLVNELEVLLEKGIKPLLFIDSQCPVTTPYDIRRNQHHHPHGSCGVGVGDTINREENHYSLTFADLFYPWVLETRFDLIRAFYQEYADISKADFFDCCAAIIDSPYIQKSYGLPQGSWSDHIYEGSQGLLLDQHYGFFPYVTRSNTGTTNAVAIAGTKSLEIYLITRAYQTRHGDGPMSNEILPHNIKINKRESNTTNCFQGAFRRTLLDLDLLEYAISRDNLIRSSSNRHLVITCLDHIRDEYRFIWKGHIVHSANEANFIRRIGEILGFDSVYTSASSDSAGIQRFFMK
ncbi:MAG: adenylosuccinate synthetase [Candidatus Electrothrix sp. AR3]|nr:adenylosuccinate synthetase [Candidatus Electrothrix sp. AR3]